MIRSLRSILKFIIISIGIVSIIYAIIKSVSFYKKYSILEPLTLGTKPRLSKSSSVDSSITLDKAGYHYVTNWGNEEREYEGRLQNPFGAVVDSQGYIYVLDKSSRILKFDNDGKFIISWGGFGKERGQLDYPEGIAMDRNDHIYVTEPMAKRIQKFTKDGIFVEQWDIEPSDEMSSYNCPRNLSFDKQNNAYVICYKEIRKYDVQKTIVKEWRVSKLTINDLAISEDGFLYAIDAYEDKIKKFDIEGNFITEWYFHNPTSPFLDAPIIHPPSFGISVDKNGFIYVVGSGGIKKFDSFGKLLVKWGGYGKEPGKFEGSCDVVVDNEGNVFIVDAQNNRIQKFKPSEPLKIKE